MKNLRFSEFLALSVSIALLVNACAATSVEPLATNIPSQPENTLEENGPLPTSVPLTISEVEEVAGFDVQDPAYLPAGASFDYATYQAVPSPRVILHFKYVHETYGDMGAFFQIVQEPQAEAMPNPAACGASGTDCEVVQIGDMVVNYRLTSPTESLMWNADGFSFQLLRTAGEPDKFYKDELLKVVESMS